MNSKTTGIWFALAVVLFAFIFVFETYFRPQPNLPSPVLAGLRSPAVTSVQVLPNGAFEICAERTNNSWILTKPITYPAQPAAVETLLATLQKLTSFKISAAELRSHENPDAEFGFDNPQSTLIITAGSQRWQLKVGNRTAPGDQVYLRVIGVEGIFVADAGWLKYLPRSADDWRSTALVDARQADFDSIILTNNAKNGSTVGAPLVIEFHRDATNGLWLMTRPLQARANGARITDALQHLLAANASQFVTDDSKADLSAYGLQPADLDLWLGHGTNFTTGIYFGKSPANDSTQVYAKREGWSAVLAVPRSALAEWRGTVNDFRDTNLVELTAPVAEIKVTAGTNSFALERQGTNGWTIPGEDFPVDTSSVQEFIAAIANLHIAEFVGDVVTPADLPTYGLNAPQRTVTLYSAVGDTNAVIAQLLFGTNQDDKVFVKRTDEDFIYAVTAEDFSMVDEADWEFRDRSIWNFAQNDVTQLTLRQNGRTCVLIHNGTNQWSLAPGSQGMIVPPAVEETVYRLGKLNAEHWLGCDITDPWTYGFNTNNLQITIELKNGEKKSLDFGGELRLPEGQTALAATTLDGVRWAFIFPPAVYQLVASFLTIPPPPGNNP
ncbi:MAG TPA: DUF4340 domain-containing protein [Verrucomicrobiae bacterium]|nr:DUF4340 domain-containing protein [Verrucomicrobiae bacterium]